MAFPIQHGNFQAEQIQFRDGRPGISIRNLATGAAVGTLDTQKCRQWLCGFQTAKMTLNAAVRIARFADGKVAGLNWQLPTDLNGSDADWPKIFPDEIIAGIGLLQAAAGVGVDGQPGGQFVKDVMGLLPNAKTNASRFNLFMDETENKATALPGEVSVPVPNRETASEVEVYDFCRTMVLARNGLWSDVPGVTNVSGLRYRKVGASNSWNDVLAVCWLENQGGSLVKRMETFLATTEPGRPRIRPTVPAQTYLMLPGYHSAKLPGGRGSCLMAKDASNTTYTFDPTDGRGINFHPGGNVVKSKSLQGVLPGGSVRDDAGFAKQLAFAEAFGTLSRWGFDPAKPAYGILKEHSNLELVEVVSANETRVDLQKGTKKKSLDVNSIRQWLAQFWISKKQNAAALQEILQNVSPGYSLPAPTTAPIVAASITAQAVADIVRHQTRFFPNLEDIDGLAGPKYLETLSGARPDLMTLRDLAAADFQGFGEIEQRGSFNSSQQNYLRKLLFDTLGERRVLGAAKLPKLKIGDVVEDVAGWSIACQVVYGMEQFYRFWTVLTQNALVTGQRHWYYTLVERGSF